MTGQKKSIIDQLSATFDGYVWYGPTVMETLSKVTTLCGQNRFKNSHSIIELIGHMTAWRRFVIARLKGNESYEVTEGVNFSETTIELKEVIQQLKDSQEEMLRAIEELPEEKLADKVPTREYTFQFMLNGIAQHDLYHLGQIALLNR